MKKIFTLFMTSVLLSAGSVFADDVLVNYEGTATLPEGVAISGTTKMANVKINTNKTGVDCIQLANGYTSNSVFNGNAIILSTEGGFKAGDVLSVTGFFNNSDDTKESKVDLFTVNEEEKCTVVWTSEQFINGRVVAEDPTAQTYTLEQDMETIMLGRKGGTGTNIWKLSVTRSSASFPTMSIAYDSLTNVLTFTPSDLEAYYYASVGSKAMFEAAEIDTDTFTAEMIAEDSFADLVSAETLVKGVQTISLTELIAQMGYGDWIAFSNFVDDKKQISETEVLNFTIAAPLAELDAPVIGTVVDDSWGTSDVKYTATFKFAKPERAVYAYSEGLHMELNGENTGVPFQFGQYGFMMLAEGDSITLTYVDNMLASTKDPDYEGDFRAAGTYQASTMISFMDENQWELPVIAKFEGTIVLPELAPEFPTMTITFDSLTNILTFTPSDQEAYYYASVGSKTMLEAAEVDVNTYTAEMFGEETFVDLVGADVLIKGTQTHSIAEQVAQMGCGEWIAFSNFVNDKMQISETEVLNFTVTVSTAIETFEAEGAQKIIIDLQGRQVGSMKAGQIYLLNGKKQIQK